MSRRVPNNNRSKVVKGEVMATSCHVCKAHGKSFTIVESHNFRDIKGRVCCPTMLENICSKCGRKGHFQSKCEGIKEFKLYKSPMTKAEEYKAKKENKEKVNVTPVNAFAALADESESEEEAIKDDPPPANVTLRKSDPKKAQKAWTDYDDEEW